jgi:hypothetical protein
MVAVGEATSWPELQRILKKAKGDLNEDDYRSLAEMAMIRRDHLD